MKLLHHVVLLAFVCFNVGAVAQESYPSKPIQLVVPLPQATSLDWVARLYADKLTQRLGQSVVVQNRPGAGGSIATSSVAQATPDGYTLLVVNSQHSINPALYNNLAYNTLRDFAGIALVGVAPTVMVVHPSLGVRTVKEFIEYAKKKPGAVRFASVGMGTTSHLGGAYFASAAGLDMGHVPYKGSQYLVDLLAGRVDSMFAPASVWVPFVKDGKLVALGVTSRQPMHVPLELPTFEAAGLPGFEFGTYYGFLAPTKTPGPILERLSKEIASIAGGEEVKTAVANQGIENRLLIGKKFDDYIKAEMDRIEPIVKASGAKGN
jgi:tripartite-type tricarboxylate transporter receptor subunit TctC